VVTLLYAQLSQSRAISFVKFDCEIRIVKCYSLKALRVKIVTHIVCQKRLHSLNSSGF